MSRYIGLASERYACNAEVSPIAIRRDAFGLPMLLSIVFVGMGDNLRGILATLAIGAALSGCATITRGTIDQVQIHSTPDGAHATTSIGQSCTTPCTLTVSRKDEFTVHYEMDGYQPQDVDVKTQVAGAGAAGFAGNVILGGIIGMGADAATGATLEHVPNPVNADLELAKTPEPQKAEAKPKKRAPKPAPSSEPVS